MTLVFVDIETTGLDPGTGLILEVGLVVTDDELVEIDRTSVVIHHRKRCVQRRLNRDPAGTVRAMHTRSGLLAEVEAAWMGPAVAEQTLLGWLRSLPVEWPDKPMWAGPLCGSNPQFDRGFLKRWMPELEAVWHYRNDDWSSTRAQAQRWSPWVMRGGPAKREVHRALPDLDDTLALARHLRRQLFDATPPRST